MPAYYLGFDVVKINASAMHERQAGETVDVWNVTDDETLGTVEANEEGVVLDGSFDLPAGTVIEFSVTGYDAAIRRTLAATSDSAIFESEVSLILENDYEETTIDPAYNDIYIKETTAAEPRKVGTITPGGTLSVPYNPAESSDIEIFAIARSAQGSSDSFDLASAVKTTVNPNRESNKPIVYQIGAVTNLSATIGVSNYSPTAQHRKTEVAYDSGFSTGLKTIITSAESMPGRILPDVMTLVRTIEATHDTDLDLTKTKYIRVSHSSNGEDFGEVSDTLTLVYPAVGGGAGYEPPTLTVSYDGETYVNLTWTDDVGGSGDWTMELRAGLGSWSVIDDTLPSATRELTNEQLRQPVSRTVFYRVKRNNESVYSNEASVYIPKEIP